MLDCKENFLTCIWIQVAHKCVFQRKDNIIAVLVAVSANGEPILPEIKHFTIDFEIDVVNDDAQHVASLALESSSDEIISTALDDCTALCASYSVHHLRQTQL